MAWLSMLPIGILQTVASIQQGTWYARSAQFLQTPTMQMLRWMRVSGDILFAAGCLIRGLFVIGLLTGHSYADSGSGSSAPEQEQRHVLIAGD